ncbi:MAG: carbohydrate ABC transporter permease [Clostridia bacterium]|nr:carbohydrate ABC transporter permease [Clostridia bacterium]
MTGTKQLQQFKENKNRNRIRRTRGDIAFDIINIAIIVLITLIMIYPMWYVLIVSFASPEEAVRGQLYFWPSTFTLEAYGKVFAEKKIWIGYGNTIIYTIAHTAYVLMLTIPSAYALSKKNMPGRVAITWYFFATMFIGGGLIPSYMLNRSLGLINTRWIMILGMGVGYSNLVITRTYYQTSIPTEVYESAYIDGATEWQTFIKIALPLSGAIVAVMALYAAVGTWGSWYSAFIYITDQSKWPLQLRLRQILILDSTQSLDINNMTQEDIMEMQHQAFLVTTMKYAIIFIACLPMLVLYPFVQKYFVKGVMIGSVKG